MDESCIITCACCDTLFKATRRLTCSPACRTLLKRHPEQLQELRQIGERFGTTPFGVLVMRAALAQLIEEEAIREAGGSLS